MIKKIDFETIYKIWEKHLWPIRVTPIESNSAMVFLGGYDLENMKTTPTFLGYFIDNELVGVNSGHKCLDNSYRSRGVYVMPEYRRNKVGQQLLTATIEQGKIEKCNFVWSYPRKSSWNTYKAAGFELASDWEKSETSEANAYCRIDI
jgi:GNAT superfamily N-acetyltransferase